MEKPVLILGAGINGAAVARDLAMNGIPVCIVDTGDIARGATSRSSRLIHGGLRYLEYRDFELVRESLRERGQLLKLAPQFVKPLRLTIPVSQRFGGLWSGFVRFSGLARTPFGQTLLKIGRGRRGLFAIQVGLSIYDWLAGKSGLPRHSSTGIQPQGQERRQNNIPDISPQRFHWLCSFSDAQIEYPERFVVALLEDARRAAASCGSSFQLLPYHQAVLSKSRQEIDLRPVEEHGTADDPHPIEAIRPAVIVNATGAWGDLTLEKLGVDERQLFAGTKGSHLFTTHPPLLNALNGSGLYAEASDGRLVFILPCAGGVLIGTTDDPFTGDPAGAVSTPDDARYLVNLVNDILPDAALTVEHIDSQHAGVRPLPRCDSQSASAIPRGHSIHRSALQDIPVLTLIGGKLTTCRSLAADVCSTICEEVSQQRQRDTSDRPICGAESFPSPENSDHHLESTALRHGLTPQQVQTLWPLVGNRFDEIFSFSMSDASDPDHVTTSLPSIEGTEIPVAFVDWSIRHEWVTKLEDLVERRLMLTFRSRLHRKTLQHLGRILVASGRLDESELESEINRASSRLREFYGKTVVED